MVSAQERIARMEATLNASSKNEPTVHILATSSGWTGFVCGLRIGNGYFDSLTDALDAAQALVDKFDSAKLAQTLGIEVSA